MPSPRAVRLVSGVVLCIVAAGAFAQQGRTVPPVRDEKTFLHALFQDHVVLQRDKEVPVWGWTEPGKKVAVALAGRSAEATADEGGRWLAKLPALPAGGPHELKVTGPQTATVRDVLIGDVWVCSGQSNMQFNLGTIRDGGKAIREADDPNLHFLTLFPSNSDFGAPTPLENLSVTKGQWRACGPETAGACSATAYFFGRDIRRRYKAPVGLLVTALNGTPIEAWISERAMMTLPVYSKGGRFSPDWDPWKTAIPSWNMPCVRYNAQVHPLAPFAIKGFLFYQGETNAMWGRGRRYRELLPLMIRAWRQRWGDETLPFIVIQLANTFGAQDPARPLPKRCKWVEVQEAQLMARRVPHVETAVILDQGDGDLHPPNKAGIGGRAALVACRVAYGEDVVVQGPTYRRMEVEGDKARLFFDDLGGGLVSKDGQPLRFFNVAGEDMSFVVADARIDGDTVVLSSPKVAEPAAVRYAWADNPLGANFFNRAGLPASPFRTDDWNPDLQPTAAFTFVTSGEDAPVAVVFDPAKSFDPDNNIVSYAWDFGDGEKSAEMSPTHVFRRAGTYKVKLTINDGDGLAAVTATGIEVAPPTGRPKAPTVLLSRSPAGGTAPLAVRLDASRSVDPDGTIASWGWDFGDGSSGSGPAVEHTYKSPGAYAATVTVTDDQGLAASEKVSVVIIGPGTGAGTILCERWRNIPGTDLEPLRKHAAFPDKPDDTTQLKSLDLPPNWGDNYGTRIRGFLHPPATGEYVFYIASDDSSELLLSADDKAAGAKAIARVRGSTGRYQWSDEGERRSQPVRLGEGKRYYIEVLHKDGTGGDHLAVAWQGPGLPLAVIDGQYLSPPAAAAR